MNKKVIEIIYGILKENDIEVLISEINDSLTQIQFKGKIVKIEEKGVKRSKRLTLVLMFH